MPLINFKNDLEKFLLLMQHRTGDNPHEPQREDQRSRAWKFILRGAYYPKSPEAFVPHVNKCSWIASQIGRFDRWTLVGVIVTTNPRNYYTLKTRYSKDCEWVPLLASKTSVIDYYTSGPLPPGFSYRWSHTNNKPYPLQKVGYNIVVPDLIQDYEAAIWAMEQRDDDPLTPEPKLFTPNPSRLPLPDEEFWQDFPDGSMMFIARFHNGELRFDLPPQD